MAATTRRSVLAATGLLAGVGAGVGIERASSDSPGQTDARRLPRSLVSRNVRMGRPGSEPGKLAPLRTRGLPYGDLTAADGTHRGRFDTSEVTGGRESSHLHRLELDNGTLVGLGSAATEGTFTIVGSSGDLTGATGAYVVRRLDDDALEFSFLNTKAV